MGSWLNGSSSSAVPQDSGIGACETGFWGGSFFSVAATALRAAFALAIVSRKVLDDFDAFLASLSACCSGDNSSCRLEVAETYLGAEGDRALVPCSVPGLRVFFTWSGLSGGPMFDFVDFVKGFAAGLLGDGRVSESLPASLPPKGFSGSVFLGGELASEVAVSDIAILCRDFG